MVCLVVMFTTNAYAGFIVYDTGGDQSRIQSAMTTMGHSYVVRDKLNPVTAADLAGAEALIVGWNFDKYSPADMAGLTLPTVLENGITGNILLTGHDADYHFASIPAANTFLRQAIDFATAQGGTGLVALADFDAVAFDYLPSSWGISAVGDIAGDDPVTIEAAGVASGVYDGLTGAAMSGWGESYHNEFTAWDPRFEVFENHHSAIPKTITIGYVVPVPAALLLGVLGLSVAGIKLRKFA